ncbi:hypothetical protein [Streptomyces sp. AK02-04a]|uniref:hypothetical protein n=1 Tax=Streptomyces sp. AK02-04a TaxID=3028649 RepID=UPI0029B38BD5|nr:hypothetical protein [Streptomyces sp. AK02-04a]MDX3763843.1 hypothetical protein [Streptomyces sp. AK02-04a]
MTGVFDEDLDDEVRPGKGLLGGGVPQVFQEATVVVRAPVGTTLDSIPAPRPPEGEGELTPQEKETLEACKAGMNNLHNAFWVAGKSLETMQTGNLHRDEGFANFAEFVWITWEISESQVYRLIDEWWIGEALSQLGHRPRESQIRELTDIKNAAGGEAAVVVYDAVARSTRRVTAKLLGDVARRLPPLTPDSSPADIRRMVRDVLGRPPAQAEGTQSLGESDGAKSVDTSSHGDGSMVHDITSLGKYGDSPVGESGPQAGNSKGSDAESMDLQRLNETLALLREASRNISKPGVKRALDQAPETAVVVLAEIESLLNKIGRTVAIRRSI